ncbi:MAG: aspartate/glutamate racemase family protein [Candidatus Heimdallarchaeota archaeon]|nr:aspartate/glutamate racemase family protein [Candidatus Heimdallarchaeota archaeon]MBY8995809.1 aspartate/glutamate racemase family protein [Candidatus Heimdallarchaeota archaeon]
MKILIINPNSDLKMTKAIQKSAENFANGEYEVICLSNPDAPRFIETYEDEIKTAPGMIELVRKNEDKYDAFIIACHCDPNIEAMKEITKKPVVGIGEASMKIASMLGHKFSVVSGSKHSIPNKEAVIRKYHLEDAMASVRAPEGDVSNLSTEEKYLQAAKLAIKEDMAEVIVLGCAGMTGFDKKLQKELGVPVLDGVVCALIIATGLVKYGVSTSKIRRYNPDLE